jgi:hypothetical protein
MCGAYFSSANCGLWEFERFVQSARTRFQADSCVACQSGMEIPHFAGRKFWQEPSLLTAANVSLTYFRM